MEDTSWLGEYEEEYLYWKRMEEEAWQKYKLARLKHLEAAERVVGHLAQGLRENA